MSGKKIKIARETGLTTLGVYFVVVLVVNCIVVLIHVTRHTHTLADVEYPKRRRMEKWKFQRSPEFSGIVFGYKGEIPGGAAINSS